jgi:EamA-like transporter family
MNPTPLSLRDGLPALAVMAVWGTNFVVIRLGLDHLPPLLFASLRFTLAVLPAVFFLPRAQVPWRKLAAYGLLIGAGQFGLMFIAMSRYITPGSRRWSFNCRRFSRSGLPPTSPASAFSASRSWRSCSRPPVSA